MSTGNDDEADLRSQLASLKDQIAFLTRLTDGQVPKILLRFACFASNKGKHGTGWCASHRGVSLCHGVQLRTHDLFASFMNVA